MSGETLLESLVEKHAHLKQTIDQEIHRPQPDQVLINTLKKQKLHLKDEILRLSNGRVEH